MGRLAKEPPGFVVTIPEPVPNQNLFGIPHSLLRCDPPSREPVPWLRRGLSPHRP